MWGKQSPRPFLSIGRLPSDLRPPSGSLRAGVRVAGFEEIQGCSSFQCHSAAVRIEIRTGSNGVVAVQPSLRAAKVRKLVAGSEHGILRLRGFLWGLAHGMALAKPALAPKKMTGLFFGVLLHSGEDASGPADQTNA